MFSSSVTTVSFCYFVFFSILLLVSCTKQSANDTASQPVPISGTGKAPIVSGFNVIPSSSMSVKVEVRGKNFETGARVVISSRTCDNVDVKASEFLTCQLSETFGFRLTDILVTNPSGLSNEPLNPTSNTPGVLISTTATAAIIISGGEGSFTTPENAYLEDGYLTTFSYAPEELSHVFALTGYFTSQASIIPDTAVIDGLVVNCKWGLSSGAAAARNINFQLHKNGSSFGVNRARGDLLSDAPTYSADFGSKTTLDWGTPAPLTKSEVISAGFGIQMQFDTGNSPPVGELGIDNCRLALYFH